MTDIKILIIDTNHKSQKQKGKHLRSIYLNNNSIRSVKENYHFICININVNFTIISILCMCGAARIPQYSCENQRQLAGACFLFPICGSREQNQFVRHSVKCWHLMGLKYKFEAKISKKKLLSVRENETNRYLGRYFVVFVLLRQGLVCSLGWFETLYVVQAGLNYTILLPHTSEAWRYRKAPSSLAPEPS